MSDLPTFTQNSNKRVHIYVGGPVQTEGRTTNIGGSYKNIFEAVLGDRSPTAYYGVGANDINVFLGQELEWSFKYKSGDPLDKVRKAITGQGGIVNNIIKGVQDFQELFSASGTPSGRYYTKLISTPSWENPERLEINGFSFDFKIGQNGRWNGREEVYNPIMALARVALARPESAGSNRLLGPLPTSAGIWKNLIEGVGAGVQAAGNDAAGFQSAIDTFLNNYESKVRQSYNNSWGKVRIQFGRIFIPDFAVDDVKVKFSNELDSNGFPIAGTITWSIAKTIIIPTTEDFPLLRATDVE